MQTCRLGHPEAVFFRLARASPHPTMPRRPGRARRAAASPLPTMAPGRRRWPPTSSSHRHIRRCAPASTIARSDDGGRPALDLASPFLAMRSTERPFRPANNDPAKINRMTAFLAGGSCRFQKTAALNVRSRLHYSSGGVGSIRQRRAAAGHQRTQGGLSATGRSMRHRWPSRRGSESARIDLRCPTSH